MSCHAGKVNRKKFSGLPKIGSATLPVARGAIPKERQRRPLPRHGTAGCSGNDKGNAERDEPQNWLNRQLHRLPADENRVTALANQGDAPASEPETIRTGREMWPPRKPRRFPTED